MITIHISFLKIFQVRRSISFPSEITQKSEPISCSSNDPSDENRISDDMTWSEMSSSLSTVHLLQDSYHSSSLTAADSGVDCSERSKPSSHYHDEDDETLLRKYDSDTALHHDRRRYSLLLSLLFKVLFSFQRNSN